MDDDDEGFEDDGVGESGGGGSCGRRGGGGDHHGGGGGARCDTRAASETATAATRTPTPKMLLKDGKIRWPVFQVNILTSARAPANDTHPRIINFIMIEIVDLHTQYGAKPGSGMLISTSVEGLVAPRKSAKRDSGPQPGRENFSLAANEVIINVAPNFKLKLN